MILRKKKDLVDKTNKSLWYSLEVDFKNLTGDEFEKLLGELYQRQGYHVTKSVPGADNGIDLMATRGNTSVIIQAKNWKGKVSNGDILKTSGARLMYNANYAMVITSSHFTDSAKNVIENSPRIRGMEIESLQKKVREYFKKEIKKSCKLPAEFVKEFSRLCSASYSHWVKAREKQDFKLFAPYLQKLMNMRMQEAHYIDPKANPYNIIVDDFEEGMTQELIDPVFAELRDGILALLQQIKRSKKYKGQKNILKKISFPADKQLEISKQIIHTILQEDARYHVAESVHPFTTRISFNDVRLTTAVRKGLPLFSFTGAAHEAGHALYEMGMSEKLKHTGLRDAPSFGLHES